MAAKTFGYMRVSTAHQVHERQEDKLAEAGVQPVDIFRDTISGASSPGTASPS